MSPHLILRFSQFSWFRQSNPVVIYKYNNKCNNEELMNLTKITNIFDGMSYERPLKNHHISQKPQIKRALNKLTLKNPGSFFILCSNYVWIELLLWIFLCVFSRISFLCKYFVYFAQEIVILYFFLFKRYTKFKKIFSTFRGSISISTSNNTFTTWGGIQF